MGGRRGGGVWSELHGFVYGYLRRRGLSRSDAEDIAQDVLEAAFVHLDAVDPGRLHAWLLVVARNGLLDRARKEKRSISVAEVPEPHDPASGPHELVLAAAEDAGVRAALDTLSDRDRELLRLRYFEERSVEQTSKAMGLSVGAAKVALLRARQRMAKVLRSQGGHDG